MPSLDPVLQARLDAFQNYKVKHPYLESMDRLLSDAIGEHTSYHLLALYGPSGVGKSTVLKRIAERARAEEPNPAYTPVVVVEALPEDVGSSARLDFYRQVLHELRGHVAVRDRIANLPLARMHGKKSLDPYEWLEVRDAVLYALEIARVKAICIDEAQNLMQSEPTQRPGAQLNWLKALTNRTNQLYILAGDYSLYDFCHLNGQAARRTRDEHFARYQLTQQTECEYFISTLKTLLSQVPLQVDISEMLQHWQWFGEWSLGCVGILGDCVVETVSSVCKAGGTTLTIAELSKHMLKPDQRLRLETEARTGEFKIEQAKAKSEQELQQLLGKALAIPKDVSSPKPSESASLPPESPPLPRGTRRVGRVAHRDPVGNEVQTLPEQHGKCSFLGPIGVTVQQFQETGVWCVECPTCGARRNMKEHRDRQRFPSHPARKTPPSKGEPRWTVREQAWVSVEK